MRKRGTEARFSNKKGQITVFIILGILILLISGIYLVTRAIKVEEYITIIPIIANVPDELLPIRTYTEACINNLAEDALKKLGTQGGYIDLEQFGISFNQVIPTEADGIQFSPNSDLNVPYWWYLKAPNN